ncbi:malate dehydrogenase, NAD-dependent [Syncephalis pseudoplumigaleata]|uniref:Malate dehydrogenase n=1 Tax=Syncephalis pseudoplumigaleata TaxID=1712513 RepID=A0A4P9Z585_9FUNG|nr:malate dehydrogenase, NAD-dependent [Syncephalis pseudoplumigaleata]|eukprot:RKP27242.1 malate dehydrogenase, NAD-dependent [Syncephalis pseudoplumigaleata]
MRTAATRAFSTSTANRTKVAVLGAAGGIGQPLSLLLKQSPLITHLSLYDIVNTPGVAADLSHINTSSKASKHIGIYVTGHLPKDGGLEEALKDAGVVVIPAGVPRKPGMTRDDLFNTNAGIVRDLATACAKTCPEAKILIIANPVNSTVPIVSEVFKQHNVYDPKRIFGVTTLDVVRASRFVSEVAGGRPEEIKITVVGGHSGATIVPLFSQTQGIKSLSKEQLDELTHRVQYGGDEVVKAKDGLGSATLSMAFAGARFTESVLRAAAGEKGVVEPTFVRSSLFEKEGVEYFSSNVELSPEGVGKIHPLGNLTPYEEELVSVAVSQLKGNITKGVQFVSESQ